MQQRTIFQSVARSLSQGRRFRGGWHVTAWKAGLLIGFHHIMNVISEALRQVIEGEDYPTPRAVISRVKACDAVCVPPGFKYSLATLVEHTDLWNRAWLARILGEPSVNVRKDWVIPTEEQWSKVRSQFLETLDRAFAVASAVPFVHGMGAEELAVLRVNRIATHTAYHLGQFVMVKRAVRAAQGQSDAPD